MKTETLHLKDAYPFLGENGCDPTVDIYLPYNMTEMHRENRKRPCMIVCPGGAYAMCSQREAEPIAMHFLPEGFNVFVIYYSVAPTVSRPSFVRSRQRLSLYTKMPIIGTAMFQSLQ